MYPRIVWQAALLAGVTFAGGLTLAWTYGQAPRPVTPTVEKPPPAILPASLTGNPSPALTIPTTSAPTVGPLADLDRLPPLARQFTLATSRGTEWLCRMNLATGRFRPGWVPALNVPLEQDSFLIQATAAWGLARAARFTGDEQHTVRAGQAVLSLLAETTDEGTPGVRRTWQPSLAANRLGSAALLVLAIHELPPLDPARDPENKELLVRAEELCRFIASRQRADGSLATGDDSTAKDAEDDVARHAGAALYALAVSARSRPAKWKAEALAKALPWCQAWWKEHPSVDFACATAAAFAESHRTTKDAATAGFVLELCDWICSRQVEQLDPRYPRRYGGFTTSAAAPSADSAKCVWVLVEACRVTRQVPDPARYERYKSSATRGLQFLTTLQYADDNTAHFTAAARPFLAGGIHASHQDGNLRADTTGWALAAFVPYLTDIAPLAKE